MKRDITLSLVKNKVRRLAWNNTGLPVEYELSEALGESLECVHRAYCRLSTRRIIMFYDFLLAIGDFTWLHPWVSFGVFFALMVLLLWVVIGPLPTVGECDHERRVHERRE